MSGLELRNHYRPYLMFTVYRIWKNKRPQLVGTFSTLDDVTLAINIDKNSMAGEFARFKHPELKIIPQYIYQKYRDLLDTNPNVKWICV